MDQIHNQWPVFGRNLNPNPIQVESKESVIINTVNNESKVCEYCNESFRGEGHSGYTRHVEACRIYGRNLKKVEGGYNCKICINQPVSPWSIKPHVYKTRMAIQNHLRSIHFKKFNDSFDHDKDNFVPHEKIKKSENKEKEENEKIIESNKKFENVKKAEVEDVPQICPNCQESFKNEQILNRHLVYIHGEKKKFECHLCTAKFVIRDSLDTHLKIIHQEKQGYTDNINIASSDETNQNCHICSETFSSEPILERHLAYVHDDKRRYRCAFCTAQFVIKDSLDTHNKIVHAETNVATSGEFQESSEVDLQGSHFMSGGI